MHQGVLFVDGILLNGEGMKDIIEEDYPWTVSRGPGEAMDVMIMERPLRYRTAGEGSIEPGVVDSKLKVFGVNNLRVIDASIIPIIPDCRIQNSVYRISEKGADIIKTAYPGLYA